MKTNYEQFIYDYFEQRFKNTASSGSINDIKIQWAFLGRMYLKLNPDVFTAGLKASCLEFENPFRVRHMNRIMAEQIVSKSVERKIVKSVFLEIKKIPKTAEDTLVIQNCLNEITEQWGKPEMVDSLIKKYRILPRKEIIATNLLKINQRDSNGKDGRSLEEGAPVFSK